MVGYPLGGDGVSVTEGVVRGPQKDVLKWSSRGSTADRLRTVDIPRSLFTYCAEWLEFWALGSICVQPTKQPIDSQGRQGRQLAFKESATIT